MSWHAKGKAVDGVITEWDAHPQVGYGADESEFDILFAKDMAAQISEHLGGAVSISAGGHSNTDRTPVDNWSADYMSLHITR